MDIALSRREREVADLVAEGLTNREIAERLVISERTAEGHVEQIRNKLGFHSRTQIAGWVERQRSGPQRAPAVAAGTIAVELPRPLLVEIPHFSRRAAALGVVALLVVVAAIALWPRAQPSPLVIVAGIGTIGYSGDDGPATSAQLDEPTSMVFDRAGALVFTDSFREFAAAPASGANGNRTHLRRIDPSGTMRTIAGGADVPRGFNLAENAQQLEIGLDARIAVGPDFRTYIATGDFLPFRAAWVGVIDEAGRFTWLAGGGFQIPPRVFELAQPRGMAIASDGTLYVSNAGTSVILAFSPRGGVSAVAGTGERGSSGDGGPATSATFLAPPSIRLAPDGSLHIVDMNNHRVRAIDHGGIVVNVAGDGTQGFGGDGGPATKARLALPADVAFAAEGTMYIADSGNSRVRAVARDGTIATVAGPADGLVRPTALAIDGSGTLFIADGGAHRIFKLARSGR